MSGSIAALSTTEIPGRKVAFLHDDHGYAGRLTAIEDEIVIIEGISVEVPHDIAEQLRPLIGRDVIVAQFGGKVSAGALA